MSTILKAETEDLTAINEMLKAEQLPLVEPNEFTQYYFKSNSSDNLINGAIGLEIYGSYGLLRSLVVDKNFRNQEIADQLVKKILETARKLKLEEIYLLTTTAEKYFLRKGFSKTDRKEAPAEIKESKEFSSLCPSSSAIMKIKIN